MFKIVSKSKYCLQNKISQKLHKSTLFSHFQIRSIINKIPTHEKEQIKEKHIVIMKDKYSVKPDKEIKISKTSENKYGKLI
jgi:hypothetical protein